MIQYSELFEAFLLLHNLEGHTNAILGAHKDMGAKMLQHKMVRVVLAV